jgi:hypothetical protein
VVEKPRCPIFKNALAALLGATSAPDSRPSIGHVPLEAVANDRFGAIYFAAKISASTVAAKSFGNGMPDAA